jgi:uncharacterized protein involved in type VI secretion and phage assembly
MQWREGAQRLIEEALLRVREALAADEAQVDLAAAGLATALECAGSNSAAVAAETALREQLAGLEEAEAEQEYLVSSVLRPGVQELAAREAALNGQLAAILAGPQGGEGSDEEFGATAEDAEVTLTFLPISPANIIYSVAWLFLSLA